MALLTSFGGLAASVRAVTKSVRFVAAQMVFSSHSEDTGTPPALSGSVSVSWRMKNSYENFTTMFSRYSKCILKILKFIDADPGWKKFGSGIDISDPQQCYFQWQNCDMMTS
jgi:hypothetical protein